MDQKIKILVFGDVNGNLKQFFNRIESINKKSGPFELVLCVGEFFNTTTTSRREEFESYRNVIKISIPVYILGTTNQNELKNYTNSTDGEIFENLTYLGKRGLYTLKSGLKIAYLSGLESNSTSKADDTFFDKDDVETLINSCLLSKSQSDYRGVDILLTSQWPEGITSQTNAKYDCSKFISHLVKEIRPRYHFCGLNSIYYEPLPFRIAPSNNVTQLELATRFISLANIGNSTKEKYVYALNITPVNKMRIIDLLQKTTNEIRCPFDSIDFSNFKKKLESNSNAQYFYDLKSPRKGKDGENDFKMTHKKRRMEIEQDKCWFCLSSIDIEKHLIIDIGENFYIALAKGPINNFHVLILPITHIPSSSLLSTDDWDELSKIKQSLKNCFKSQGKCVCFFERHYQTAHLQINAIGIDDEFEWKIKHAFEDKSEEYNLQLEELKEIEEPSELPQRGPYFWVELPNKEERICMLTRNMKRFPIQFAREAFCCENLLNCDEKIDWRQCDLNKDEEIQIVNEFREVYKKFKPI